jgi:hypothetical protein
MLIAILCGVILVLLSRNQPFATDKKDPNVNGSLIAVELDRLVGDYNATLAIIDQKYEENTKIIETEGQLQTQNIDSMNKLNAYGDYSNANKVSQESLDDSRRSLERYRKYVSDMETLLLRAAQLRSRIDTNLLTKSRYRQTKYISNADGYAVKTKNVPLQYLERR